MTAKEFDQTLESRDSFTKLTPTGISENKEAVYEFAEKYAEYLISQQPNFM